MATMSNNIAWKLYSGDEVTSLAGMLWKGCRMAISQCHLMTIQRTWESTKLCTIIWSFNCIELLLFSISQLEKKVYGLNTNRVIFILHMKDHKMAATILQLLIYIVIISFSLVIYICAPCFCNGFRELKLIY